jgi:phage terminase large subunit GpA-like protein
MEEFVKRIFGESKRVMEPPPTLTVSQWAEQYRYLSAESSSSPGKFEIGFAGYQRGIMDAFNDPEIESVIAMMPSQVGKSEMINNIIGYHIAVDPSPILALFPTLSMAETWSKDRLAPMLRDTPCLHGKVKDPRARDSGNTVLHKSFPGGHVTACGSNSPASLASRPIRLVLIDEADRMHTAGTEGDPISLSKKRAATFWNRKFFINSTPTIKGASKIELLFENSSQRFYWVACKHCSEFQRMEWKQVKWNEGDEGAARYFCVSCEEPWEEHERLKSLSEGEWRMEGEKSKVAGFYLNGLSSPWITIPQAVEDFLEAKKHPEKLKVFVNTYLCESWEDQGEQIDDLDLYNRRENYGADIPEKVVLVVCGADVQDDRIEFECLGIARNEETFSISYGTIYGDPSAPEIWERFDEALLKTWIHPLYGEMGIKAACIDSGHHTKAVYAFCKPREGRRVFAVKGVGGENRPIVGRPTKNNIGKVKLFPIGVNTAKALVFSRLKIAEPGPGYCHFPDTYDQEYFKQLTAEKLQTRYVKGFRRESFVKIRERNEALDVRVYALVAYMLLNANIAKIAKNLEGRIITRKRIEEPPEEPPTQQKKISKRIRPQKRGNWATNY